MLEETIGLGKTNKEAEKRKKDEEEMKKRKREEEKKKREEEMMGRMKRMKKCPSSLSKEDSSTLEDNKEENTAIEVKGDGKKKMEGGGRKYLDEIQQKVKESLEKSLKIDDRVRMKTVKEETSQTVGFFKVVELKNLSKCQKFLL